MHQVIRSALLPLAQLVDQLPVDAAAVDTLGGLLKFLEVGGKFLDFSLQQQPAEIAVAGQAGDGVNVSGIFGKFFNMGPELCNYLLGGGIGGDVRAGLEALELRLRGAELRQSRLAAAQHAILQFKNFFPVHKPGDFLFIHAHADTVPLARGDRTWWKPDQGSSMTARQGPRKRVRRMFPALG